MADHDDRQPACCVQVPNHLQNAVSSRGVQPGGRLVQNEHARPHGQHARDGHTAHLPAAELEGRALGHLVVVQAHLQHRPAHAPVDLLRIQPHVAGAEGDVPGHGLLKQLVFRILEYQPYLFAHLQQAYALLGQVQPIHHHAAGCGLDEPVQMLHQRGLAAARVAQKANELAVLDGQAHIVERHGGKGASGHVGVRKMLYLDGHSAFFSSFTISATVRMPSGRTSPPALRRMASSAMGGTSSPRALTF